MVEWHNQHFEGYLFETPPDQILADTRKRAEAPHRRYRLGNYARLALLFVLASATVISFYEVHAVGGRIALLVVMPAVLCELLLRPKWRAEEYNERLAVPLRNFLVEERARVLRRIRRTKWQIAWYAVTALRGSFICSSGQRYPGWETSSTLSAHSYWDCCSFTLSLSSTGLLDCARSS